MLNAHFKTIARRAKMSDRLALHIFAWWFLVIPSGYCVWLSRLVISRVASYDNHQPRYHKPLSGLIDDTWGWASKDGIGLRLTQRIELAGHRFVM